MPEASATDEQRAAHHIALRWAHVLAWQVDRLYAARQGVLSAHQAVRDQARYDHDDSWPFFRMYAEAHFALVAARQLLRALRAFDGNDRLPASLPEDRLRLLRDALEHWDEPAGRAAKQMSELGAEASRHRWSAEGPGLLGDLVEDAVLRGWAEAVYAELVRWEPW